MDGTDGNRSQAENQKAPPARIQRWLLSLGAIALAGALTGIGVASAIRVPRISRLSEFRPHLVTQILDRQGKPFASYARERRHLIREGELPRWVEHAVLAAEDAQFFQHGGIDLKGIVRSAWVNLQRGRPSQGASTITMQLARQLFLTREKSWRRKLEEALLAVEIEKTLSKQQILTLYCNLMFFGQGYYGVEAAARGYFGKTASQLEPHEAALLAGLLQRPSDFNPVRHPEKALQRRNYVLRRMWEEGFLNRAQYQTAVARPIELAVSVPRPELAPYFAEEVRLYLERRYGTETLYGDGLLVRTTLDPQLQKDAEESLREGLIRLDRRRGWRGPLSRSVPTNSTRRQLEELAGRNPVPDEWVPGVVLSSGPGELLVSLGDSSLALPPEAVAWTGRRPGDILRPGDLAWFRPKPDPKGSTTAWELVQEPLVEGAVVVLESATGAVRALVGGWDFQRSKFNRVTQAQRQVGSAFKPIVYAAALEHGFTAADVVFDAPALFLGADGRASYAPKNYYRRYVGIVTLRQALEKSINVPAVKLLDLVGVDAVLDVARRLGIRSQLPPYPSLALGSADLVPLELAAAYAAIANQGIWVRPYLVEEVTTPQGRALERASIDARKALEAPVAYVLTAMLEGVVDRGTAAQLANLPLALAGKTGTTNDYGDAWFVGFTPRFTILTWVGFDQKRSLGAKMTGAAAALPIWQSLITKGLEHGWAHPDETFSVPSDVEFHTVDYWTGLAATPDTPRTIREAFVASTQPRGVWQPQWETIRQLPWPQQLAFYRPHPGERLPTREAVALVMGPAEEDQPGD